MKTFPVLFLFLGLAFTSSAQIERKPATSVKTDSVQPASSQNTADRKNRKALMNDMDLTPEQRNKMKEFMQSNKAAKEAIENNDQLSESEKKKQLLELQKAQVQKLQTILTPEQLKKFRSARQKNQ